MSTQLLTDAFIVSAFGNNGSGKFQYLVSFEHYYRHEYPIGYVWADTKSEALKFAREYGHRFLNCGVLSVEKEI